MGESVGVALSSGSNIIFLVLCLIVGFCIAFTEPAVRVLSVQVEDVTQGNISRKGVTVAIAISLMLAVFLAGIKIIFDISIFYILVIGYSVIVFLMLFTPKTFTSLAFDSGGVASGPLTSTFILPFIIGICYVLQGESAILLDAFGLVAMVAMTPLITIQALGFKAIASKHLRERSAMKRILDEDDEQIIRFM